MSRLALSTNSRPRHAEWVSTQDVLVVDDEPDLAETTAGILRNAGFTAMTARDVDGALRLAEAHTFKVFVLDHHLDHTCEAIISGVKRLPPVIIVSAAHPADLEIVRRRHVKVFSVKTKPCDPPDLIETVRAAIAAA